MGLRVSRAELTAGRGSASGGRCAEDPFRLLGDENWAKRLAVDVNTEPGVWAGWLVPTGEKTSPKATTM